MFNDKNLICTSNELSILQKNYEYYSSDDIMQKGYFPQKCGLKDGDFVAKVNIGKLDNITDTYEKTEYYITSDYSGVLTAKPVNKENNKENNVEGVGITKIIELTEDEYNAIEEKDATTLYIIIEEDEEI